jgi:hypothetical protein
MRIGESKFSDDSFGSKGLDAVVGSSGSMVCRQYCAKSQKASARGITSGRRGNHAPRHELARQWYFADTSILDYRFDRFPDGH